VACIGSKQKSVLKEDPIIKDDKGEAEDFKSFKTLDLNDNEEGPHSPDHERNK
jgi:hypothetical protein